MNIIFVSLALILIFKIIFVFLFIFVTSFFVYFFGFFISFMVYLIEKGIKDYELGTKNQVCVILDRSTYLRKGNINICIVVE